MDAASPGVVVWITGRPQSGKSTFAGQFAAQARHHVGSLVVLDGDEVRSALVPAPGYDATARDAFYATLANLAALIAGQGSVVVVPATAHTAAFRERARERAGQRFVEVFIAADEATARARDSKGLYAAAERGEAPGLPSSSYETPARPDVVASGGFDEPAIAAALERTLELVAATKPPSHRTEHRS